MKFSIYTLAGMEWQEIEVSESAQLLARAALSAGHKLFASGGWLDIQVNGFAGYDLSAANLMPEHLLAITRSLRQEGVTNWCPTLITGTFERTLANIRTIGEARQRFPEVKHAVAGIHLEGPYLSPLEGVRGVHPRRLRRWDATDRNAIHQHRRRPRCGPQHIARLSGGDSCPRGD